MGVIPQGVTHLVESVVSYLYIILLILVIVKIIQLVGSFAGFGGGGGGDSGKTRKPGDDDDPNNTDKSSKDNRTSNTKKKRPHYTYLDPTRLGKVQFKVEDVEGNPVRGAEIIVTPNRQKRRFSEPASPAPGGTVEAPPDDKDK